MKQEKLVGEAMEKVFADVKTAMEGTSEFAERVRAAHATTLLAGMAAAYHRSRMLLEVCAESMSSTDREKAVAGSRIAHALGMAATRLSHAAADARTDDPDGALYVRMSALIAEENSRAATAQLFANKSATPTLH